MDTLLQLDFRLFHFINTDCSTFLLDAICPILRDRMTWIPLYIMLGIWVMYKYKLDSLPMIVGVLLCFALADTISYQLLKPLIHRLRPCHNTLVHARLVLGHCGGNWSFPSSHASNHMAISMGIILFGIFKNKWVNGLMIIWALTVGFSQIYVGVHYPTDILAGFLLGTGCAFASKYILHLIGERLFSTK